MASLQHSDSSAISTSEEVELIPELSYVPRAGVVGSYGGGDAMQMARTIWLRKRSSTMISGSLRQSILQSVATALQKQSAIAPAKRVAHLPEKMPDLSAMQWSAHVEFSSHVYGEASCNMMYQGLLFAHICQDRQRKGAVKWPLVGLFQADGVFPGDPNEPADIGFDALKWADQHIHKVEDFDDHWHFGSDMSRFTINSEQPIVKAWSVCVDLSHPGREWCDVTFLWMVAGELEDSVDKAVATVGRLASFADKRPTLAEYDALLCDTLAKTTTVPSVRIEELREILLNSQK